MTKNVNIYHNIPNDNNSMKMADLLGSLALKAPCRPASITAFQRYSMKNGNMCCSTVPFVCDAPLVLREVRA